MKRTGLKYRFDREKLNSVWAFNFRCFLCEESGADCFHHIKSSPSSDYKIGEFNKSVCNSFPIHNEGCHLYNPELHRIENEKMMLVKVFRYLLKNNYVFEEIDKEFIRKYRENYR